MKCNLSGADIKALTLALASRLDPFSLRVIVYSSTGDELEEAYIGRNLPLNQAIFELLIVLEKLGITDRFLKEVYLNSPDRPELQAEIARLCPTAAQPIREGGAALAVQQAGTPDPAAPDLARAPGLQRNVRPHLAKLDLHLWLERLIEIERRVCRVELDNNPLGTGFLVGPAAVLTNWHVVKGVHEAGKLSGVACRFDYLRLADGVRQEGVAIALAAKPLLDSSPFSPAEDTQTPETPPPEPHELDYALLNLAEPVGSERGYVLLPQDSLAMAPGAPLLIVQHPDGAPMKLALDTEAVISLNENKTRLRYRTNTDSGSSGSPCFNMDWDLVALHHLGDPAWGNPKFNQGVPAELIRKRIVDQGFGAALSDGKSG